MTIDKSLQITEALREQLKKPIGTLIPGSEENLGQAVTVIAKNISENKPTLVVTVGDIVAKSFNEIGIQMDIAIVDFIVKRVETFQNISEIGFAKTEPDSVVNNPKGTVTPESFTAIKKATENSGEKPYIIRVVGEEDLLTLAVIIAAPVGSHVFYGQPNEGIVDVEITEEKKLEVQNIIKQFDIT